jgi:hypothetical protein
MEEALQGSETNSRIISSRVGFQRPFLLQCLSFVNMIRGHEGCYYVERLNEHQL